MRERQTDRDGYSGKEESAFGGIVKTKTGAEMVQILAERALMPTIILMNLVKLYATMPGISFMFTYGGTRKGQNEVFSRSQWSTQDMTDFHHVEKKVKFLSGPSHCSAFPFDAWPLPCCRPERRRGR